MSSTKKIIRKKRILTKKQEAIKRDEYIEQYSKLTDVQLLNEANKIIKNNNMVANEKETRLISLKHVVDNKLFNKDFFQKDISSDNFYYPDYSDTEFNKKIYRKKEFYINKYPKPKYSDKFNYNKLSNDKCSGFKLSNTQKFVKNYISPNTPYNGILLFHGVGVGKTCSSISIAEAFIPELEKVNKKINILLNPSIKENFIKNIFNIQKYLDGKPLEQCTRDKYIRYIGKKTIGNKYDEKKLRSKIDRYINRRYNFYGYITFANKIEKIEENCNKLTKDIKLRKKIKEQQIRDEFDNSVMIIDEAHNIKDDSLSTKVLPPMLEYVVSVAKNMKLILLSATPMFNDPTEIVFLLNLLLMNDKKPTLKIGDIFDKNNDFVEPNGRELLIYKSRGYISYMRGENPISFPIRLDPKVTIPSNMFPINNVKGERIETKLKHLKIIGCVMKGPQLETYNNIENENFGAFNRPGMMTSNMVFPTKNIDKSVGINGFNSTFQKIGKKFTLKKNIDADFLDIKNIENYSSKIKAIIDNINTSNGIVFIYSQFIWGGLMPLVMALEYNGYSNYNGDLLNIPNKKDKNGMNYIIISGDKEISQRTYEKYIKIEHNNVNGDKVKIILGSESAAEGLDFKYVREVHILDPWYHLNKIEQVIGRGIRYCSHIKLPINERNVTVYMYAATKSANPANDVETVDLKIYRDAENKSIKMANVEYELKLNSIDCNLNIEANKFIDEFWNQNIEMINSKGDKVRINLKDKDNSRLCNYRKCDFKCYNEMPSVLNKDVLETSTFNIFNLKEQLYDVMDNIKILYKKQLIYELDEILEKISEDKDIVLMSLEELIKNKEKLVDSNNREGILTYKNKYYVFEPIELESQKLSIGDIMLPVNNKTNSLNITDLLEEVVKKEQPIIKDIKVEDLQQILNIKLDNIYLINENSLSRKEVDNRNRIHRLKKVKYDKDIIDNSRVIINKLKELEKNTKLQLLYLSNAKKESILKNIIKKMANSKYNLTDNEKELINLFKTNIMYYKAHVYFKDPINYEGNEKIWGYKIAKNNNLYYYKLDGDNFIKATENEVTFIKKSFNKKLKRTQSLLIGYLEEKNDAIYFKIRDKRIQGAKKTQIKTGSVCGNDGMKKDKIFDYISESNKDSNILNTYFNKGLLCKQLELYLIKNDIDRVNNKRWFFNVEESIEYKLNKK